MTKNYQLRLKIAFFISLIFASVNCFSQNEDSTKDITLPSVIIKAFEQNRKLKDIPASVNYIGKTALESFGNASIVSAINSTPGVRMEERSPGSYRINIRGSSLRSPFGVRNVKIYYNDIPFTDPGGHSYLNQLGYYNFKSIEILKGPNNSLYGAGTGGVMLIESMSDKDKPGFFSEYSAGSFNQQNIYTALTSANNKSISRVGFQHMQSDGYRDHTKLKRDVFTWNNLLHIGENNLLKTTFLFGHLFYETPGALTKTEFDADPKKARPGTGAFPGAEAANTSIGQTMFLAGTSYTQHISSNFQNRTTLYGMFTELRNPALRNYGKSAEPHTGARTVFKFNRLVNTVLFNFDFGGEIQRGFTSASIYKNVNGNADSLRTFDEINNRQQFLFSQLSLELNNWTIIAGASWNALHVKFQRFSPASFGKQNRTFNNETAPRLSILKKLGEINIYASVARGFSPPTTSELLPTGGAINLGLNAEEGVNYETGLKATIFKKLYVDINTFIFSLKNTIVLRRDAGGGDFYLNAGSTKQHGIETFITYPLFYNSPKFKNCVMWLSDTWHNFHYKNFKQLANDFTGKQVPSVAPHTVSSGVDVAMNNGLLGTITYFYSDKIPLNDGNTEYAKSYHLIGAKIGFQKCLPAGQAGYKNKLGIKMFGGVENLLNEIYSLGNDINGFGGRYYNPAARRNFYAGISFQFVTKRNLNILPQ